MSFAHRLYDEPKDRCQACTVYMAEGEVELPSGAVLQFCRSCMTPVRRQLKSLFKLMEKRATEYNEEKELKR